MLPEGVEVRCSALPAHTGPSLTVASPIVPMNTLVIPLAEHPEPGAVIVTVYVPDPVDVSPSSVGFCTAGTNVGPLHA